MRFADDIGAVAEEEPLETLVGSRDKTCTRYKMEIRAEKAKLMTNSDSGFKREITVKGQKLGTEQASGTLEQLFQMMAPNQTEYHCSCPKAEAHLEG